MNGVEEIVPGIYTAPHAVADGKNAIVIGQRSALIIDTGTYVEEGQLLVDFVHSRERRPNRLLYTHGHGDHILGSQAFLTGNDDGVRSPVDGGAIDLEVMAHILTPAEMERLLPALARRQESSVGELSRRIAWPTITFRDELFVDLGGFHLHVFPTPGHSQDGVSVYVEEHQLLIAGDAVVTSIVPAIGDGDSQILEATLRGLQAWPIEILVPGHGSVVQGQSAVQDWLIWLPDYLAEARRLVQEALDKGVEPDKIGATVTYEDLIGDRLPRARHNMPRRHQATVAKIVREEQGRRA